ncbi:SocA family protein [bacterium]|nr:SocA family protein [bacterium]
MEYPFPINIDKLIETIVYIANNVKHKTFLHIFKVFYFADKDHLERYGRFICGDHYVAMKFGPVPSLVYDVLKYARGDSTFFAPPTEKAQVISKAITVRGKFVVKAMRKANESEFSQSDLECLNSAISKFGKIPFEELSELSHDQAWQDTCRNDIISIETIANTLKDSAGILDYLNNPYPDVK